MCVYKVQVLIVVQCSVTSVVYFRMFFLGHDDSSG